MSVKVGEEALLPCPCCGSGAVHGRDDMFRHWVECTGCGLRTEPTRYILLGPDQAEREEAALWNRRTPCEESR